MNNNCGGTSTGFSIWPSCSSFSIARSHNVIWLSEPEAANTELSVASHSTEVMAAVWCLKRATGSPLGTRRYKIELKLKYKRKFRFISKMIPQLRWFTCRTETDALVFLSSRLYFFFRGKSRFRRENVDVDLKIDERQFGKLFQRFRAANV